MKERSLIEKLWREEKYHVLLHSQNDYNKIRAFLKQDVSLSEVQHLIDEALQTTPTSGSILNAYDHMWGYFKTLATEEEKAQSQHLKQEFQHNHIDYQSLLSFLKSLADKYEVSYLQQSRVLQQ